MSDHAIVAALDDLYGVLDRQNGLAEQHLELARERADTEKTAWAAAPVEQAKNRRLLLVAHALGGLLASGAGGTEAVRGAVEYADLAIEMLEGKRDE